MPITREMFIASQPGVNTIRQQAGENDRSAMEAALRQYLQAKEPEIAGQKQAAQNSANMDTLESPRLDKFLNDNGSVKVGDISVGADPMARALLASDKGEENARQKAIANYNKSLPKLQATFQAANEGIQFVNDPRNPGSLGQARTLALKAMGMNRYNENEAAAVVPPALQGTISQLFNQAGGDLNPLNPAQRAALNQFFKQQLHTTKKQHDLLKQASLETYDSSRYAGAVGHQQLSNRLGGGFNQALEDADKQNAQLPATSGPNMAAAPNPGPLDKLKAFLGLGGQTPAAPQAPMNFEDWKKANGR